MRLITCHHILPLCGVGKIKMPNIFDLKKLAVENPLQDENKYEISVPEDYSTRRQNPWENAIAGRIADTMSTGHFLSRSKSTENNPTLKWAGNHPGKTVAGLLATDLAMLPVAKMIERKHPKIAKAMLMGIGGFGTHLAMQNLKHERQYPNAKNEEVISQGNRIDEYVRRNRR